MSRRVPEPVCRLTKRSALRAMSLKLRTRDGLPRGRINPCSRSTKRISRSRRGSSQRRKGANSRVLERDVKARHRDPSLGELLQRMQAAHERHVEVDPRRRRQHVAQRDQREIVAGRDMQRDRLVPFGAQGRGADVDGQAQQQAHQVLLGGSLRGEQLRAGGRQARAAAALELHERRAEPGFVVAQEAPCGAIRHGAQRHRGGQRARHFDRFEQRQQPGVEQLVRVALHHPGQRRDEVHYVYWCIF